MLYGFSFSSIHIPPFHIPKNHRYNARSGYSLPSIINSYGFV